MLTYKPNSNYHSSMAISCTTEEQILIAKHYSIRNYNFKTPLLKESPVVYITQSGCQSTPPSTHFKFNDMFLQILKLNFKL